MRNMLLAGVVAVGALLGLGQQAQAAFTVPPNLGFLTVTDYSAFTFTFEGASAGDTDLLLGGVTIFNNKTTALGATKTVFFGPGTFQLTLKDTTVPNTWTANSTNFASTTNFGDFNLGAAPVVKSIYYGWEDRPLGTSDRDYNDLVFAVDVTKVPEPVTLSLLGMGLAGLGLVRRRRG